MGSIFLQLFLYLDVFLIGAIAAIAVRHAYAHFRPHEEEAQKPHTPPQNGLPPAVKNHLMEVAQTNLQTVLDRSAAQLQQDLGATEARLTKQLEKLGTEIVGKEMERYHVELEKLRKQTENVTKGAEADLTGHQTDLKAKLNEELVAEKQHLIQQIDTKLADAVASFLIETLQHNVDLGAQSAYLTSMLEEHKADFKQEVADEAPAPK